MEGLEKQGFLSGEISNVVATVHERYEAWLQVIYNINRFAVEAQHCIAVHRGNLQEVFVATLFARTLSNVQGAVVLAERGMEAQSRVSLRSAMDSLFSLLAIANDAEMANAFAIADELERKRMLIKARAWTTQSLKAEADASATEEKLAEIQDSIRENGAKSISSKDMAVKAGLEDWYNTAYSVFSGTVHSNARDLERHLVLDADGEIAALCNEPAIEELDRLFLTAAEITLMALIAIGKVFDYRVEVFRSEQLTALEALGSTISS